MTFVRARRWATALSLVTAAAIPAQAQEVTLNATTAGCFYLFTSPASCVAGPLSFIRGGTLAFTGGSFSGTTVGGVLGNLNLGTFTVTGPGPITGNSPDWYFRLTTLFTAPTVIVGGQSSTFAADLVGRITDGGNGSVNVEWTVPTSQTFNYGNAVETGTFTYGLVDRNGNGAGLANPGPLNLQANTSGNVIGEITGAHSVVATPEPATVGLMATGLLGIFAIRRRKA